MQDIKIIIIIIKIIMIIIIIIIIIVTTRLPHSNWSSSTLSYEHF